MSPSGHTFSKPATPFELKSYFCHVVQNATLNTFEKKVNYEIEKLLSIKNKQYQQNLTKEEREALKELSENNNVVIKRVVWGYEQYIKEAHRQLGDTTFYVPLTQWFSNFFCHSPLRTRGPFQAPPVPLRSHKMVGQA